MRLMVCVLLIGFSQGVSAAERFKGCVRYETQEGWSQGYKVEATKLSGSELNTATRSYRFEGFATYVTVWWNQDEVTIIKMDYPYLSAIESEGIDQQGRHWRVAKTSFCL